MNPGGALHPGRLNPGSPWGSVSRESERDRCYVERYRRKPERSGCAEMGARLAAEVLPEEPWE